VQAALFEREFCRHLSRVAKAVAGRGPVHVTAHLSGHTIYAKYKFEYTKLERQIFKQHQIKGKITESKLLYAELQSLINSFLEKFAEGIHLEDMVAYPDPDRDFAYVIFILNDNLEKMLRESNSRIKWVRLEAE